jgi:hypothetical protein
MYAATGSYRNQPQSGQPFSYTAVRLDQRKELLKKEPCKEHTAASPVPLAISNGISHTGANMRVAMRAWERHVITHGKRLTASSTSTHFLLIMTGAKESLEYNEAMLGLLRTEGGVSCIFLDEVVLETNPHPKPGLWRI